MIKKAYVLLSGILIGACVRSIIVDAKDVKFDEIAKIEVMGKPYLRIRGLVFHSSYGVDDIEVKRQDGSVIVLMKLVLARKGLTGTFEKDIPLQQGDRRVLFGPAGAQIWSAP